MQVTILGNPIAGRGHALPRIRELAEILAQWGHDVEVLLSRSSGDIGRMAGCMAPTVERLVIVGGDGTLNEALNGLVDPSRTPVLVMPAGTANMLGQDLHLPQAPRQVARLLEQGSIRKFDMGFIGTRRFLLLASAGFDAMVTEALKNRGKRTLGYHGYLNPILQTIAKYKPNKLHVRIDDHINLEGAAVMVLKIRRYGGMMVFSEEARPDSGYLHICVFREGSISDIVRYGLAGLMRLTSQLPDVAYRTGKRVKIESLEPVPVEVDGDYFGTTPVDIGLQPALVPFVVP